MHSIIVTSPVNTMKPFQIAIILYGLSQTYPCYSYVPIHSDQCECKGYNKNSRSIIVKDTMWVWKIRIVQEMFTRNPELSRWSTIIWMDLVDSPGFLLNVDFYDSFTYHTISGETLATRCLHTLYCICSSWNMDMIFMSQK